MGDSQSIVVALAAALVGLLNSCAILAGSACAAVAASKALALRLGWPSFSRIAALFGGVVGVVLTSWEFGWILENAR